MDRISYVGPLKFCKRATPSFAISRENTCFEQYPDLGTTLPLQIRSTSHYHSLFNINGKIDDRSQRNNVNANKNASISARLRDTFILFCHMPFDNPVFRPQSQRGQNPKFPDFWIFRFPDSPIPRFPSGIPGGTSPA